MFEFQLSSDEKLRCLQASATKVLTNLETMSFAELQSLLSKIHNILGEQARVIIPKYMCNLPLHVTEFKFNLQ